MSRTRLSVNLKTVLAHLLLLLAMFPAVAQVNVRGRVIDRETNEPIVGASVIVKGADGKIKNSLHQRLTAVLSCKYRQLTVAD